MTMKDQKTINLVADIIAPFAVISATVALFFIFMPTEPGKLFWTNMVYSVFLEVILFSYIAWLPKRGSSVVLKWMSGIYSVFYIGIALVWMLLFSILLHHWLPIKVYLAVIMVLTVLWVLVGALTIKIDKATDNSSVSLAANRRQADYIATNAEMLSQQFNLILMAHPELTYLSSSVTALCRGLSTVSPAVMSDPNFSRRVASICSGLEEILAEPVSENFAANLKEYSEKSIITLNSIKKSVRK